jgi:hypothetical protein
VTQLLKARLTHLAVLVSLFVPVLMGVVRPFGFSDGAE